eukprot:scaffold3257_cov152-Amphora_coffeaeformis.AAC.8
MATESLTRKIQQCRASTNESFDPKDTTLDEFRLPWDRTLAILGVASSSSSSASSLSEEWLQRLWTLHTEPTRHYHTVIHLQEMFEYFEVIREDLKLSKKQETAIVMSIYFHDAIYDPHSGTNEEDSEQLWRSFVTDINLTEQHKDIVEEVSAYILATKKHSVNPDNSQAMALFLDLDLAVLAKKSSAYTSYAAMIRREYHFVPVETYCFKRPEILQAMASQEHLYGSPAFQGMEEKARRNLRNEVDLLRKGEIPS